jgi:hypothetical protein
MNRIISVSPEQRKDQELVDVVTGLHPLVFPALCRLAIMLIADPFPGLLLETQL